MSWPECEIRLEVHPTNPPKPVGFVVFLNGQATAVLTIDQLRAAISEWDKVAEAWPEMTTLEERSSEICDIASQAAGDGPGWNARFLAELSRHGWAIHAVPKRAYLGEDPPIVAPLPMEDDPPSYPYPSVIAPIGWEPPK